MTTATHAHTQTYAQRDRQNSPIVHAASSHAALLMGSRANCLSLCEGLPNTMLSTGTDHDLVGTSRPNGGRGRVLDVAKCRF